VARYIATERRREEMRAVYRKNPSFTRRTFFDPIDNGGIAMPARVYSYEDAVINPDTRICEVLAGLAAHTYKAWCFPTQDKICELLKRFTGRTMSRRTLNRHLAALERDGQLRRQPRHYRDKHKGMVLRSTLYVIAGRFMARIGRIVTASKRWAEARKKSNAENPAAFRSGVRVPSLAQYKNPSLKGYRSRR
jgi:DNA-binding HxlR family transcriptional regulator